MTDSSDGAFTAEQYAAAYPPGIERHWWMRGRTAILDTLLHEAPGPVLEIGCGAGVVVASLRTLGHDCRGVELANVEPLASVRDVVTTGRAALALPSAARESVCTILLLDVLEHIEEPQSFLSELQSGFAGLRQVIVTVPARSELWSNYDEYFGHYRRYDLAGLRVLAARNGWHVRRVGYAFRITYLPALLLAKVGIRRAVALHAPTGALTYAHGALAAMARFEWAVLPHWWAGSSAIACFDVPAP